MEFTLKSQEHQPRHHSSVLYSNREDAYFKRKVLEDFGKLGGDANGSGSVGGNHWGDMATEREEESNRQKRMRGEKVKKEWIH